MLLGERQLPCSQAVYTFLPMRNLSIGKTSLTPASLLFLCQAAARGVLAWLRTPHNLERPLPIGLREAEKDAACSFPPSSSSPLQRTWQPQEVAAEAASRSCPAPRHFRFWSRQEPGREGLETEAESQREAAAAA